MENLKKLKTYRSDFLDTPGRDTPFTPLLGFNGSFLHEAVRCQMVSLMPCKSKRVDIRLHEQDIIEIDLHSGHVLVVRRVGIWE